MLMIRLARTGKKKKAQFRLIVSDKTKDTFGTNLEILGSLDPHQDPPKALFNADRIKFWLGKGAQTSARVHFTS
jgi:small subunit ribosomal protein S16